MQKDGYTSKNHRHTGLFCGDHDGGNISMMRVEMMYRGYTTLVRREEVNAMRAERLATYV